MKTPLSRMMTRSFVLKSLLLLSIFAVSVFASAQTAGYDLLQTGSGASIDLSSVNLGNVPLTGVPIQGGTGTTDTIMHRTQDVPQGGGSVPLEVTALFMKSTSSAGSGSMSKAMPTWSRFANFFPVPPAAKSVSPSALLARVFSVGLPHG